ncbi:dTDP-4-dehydrorhamnose 3,5-epimerase [Lacrimispora sp. BS-2]|uniref:dTDP-4-dehydrorhamnose 3,5-epimerase n=1 Tax=Lacrimispora sp. BS-2 TaxID=3151850 RepID=A0AAU7PNW9_9FIRM
MRIQIEENIGKIEGLTLIIPEIIRDNKGTFMETFNGQALNSVGLSSKFVQDNQVFNIGSVLRGLHVNINNPQAKLIRVLNGSIFDVVVDLRKSSSTYTKWYGVELNSENRKQLYIPEGFAHGYYVQSNTAEVLFKVTTHWVPNDEIGIAWDSKELGIQWPLKDRTKPIMNEKDANNKSFVDIFGKR